jgi:transcriptional regulator with XRE-family HTH domain
VSSFEAQGKIIRKARKAAGLSQGDISKKMGWKSSQFISNIERGIAGIPEFQLDRIVKLLNLDRWELYHILMNDYADRLQKALRLNQGKQK